MSHVENSRLVEFSFGAESLFKLLNMFITSTYELTFELQNIIILILIPIEQLYITTSCNKTKLQVTSQSLNYISNNFSTFNNLVTISKHILFVYL